MRLGANLDRVRETVIQLTSGWTEAAASSGGEEIGVFTETVAEMVEVAADDAPTCPNCFGSLDETLAVKIWRRRPTTNPSP